MSDSKWMTPEEVADRLGVTARTVSRWADAGQLASVRTFGGHRRFLREDIERFEIKMGVVPSDDGVA